MIRTYNPVQRRAGVRRAVDDRLRRRPTVPGLHRGHAARIEDFVRPIAEAGVVPVGMGGDHSVTLAELRAVASVHGPLGLLHFDSHTDLWDTYNGRPVSHGTMFRRAIEEGSSTRRARCRSACAARSTAPTTRRSPATSASRRSRGTSSRAGRREHSPSTRATGSATRPRSSRSTSTSSTPRSAPAPARRRSAGRPASRRCSSCGLHGPRPSSASTWWRSPRRTTARARSPPCSRPTRSSRCCRS